MTTKYEQYQQQLTTLKTDDINIFENHNREPLKQCLIAILKESEAELPFEAKVDLIGNAVQSQEFFGLLIMKDFLTELANGQENPDVYRTQFKLLCAQSIGGLTEHTVLVTSYVKALSTSLQYAFVDASSTDMIADHAKAYQALLLTLQKQLEPQVFLRLLQHKIRYRKAGQEWVGYLGTVKDRLEALAAGVSGGVHWHQLLGQYNGFYGQAIATALGDLREPLSKEDQNDLIKEKPLVSQYLLSLDKTHQELLEKALAKSTAIGHFCAQKTGSMPWKKAQLVLDIEAKLKGWAPKLVAPNAKALSGLNSTASPVRTAGTNSNVSRFEFAIERKHSNDNL